MKTERRKRSMRSRIVRTTAALMGATSAFYAAGAVTNWTVSLNGGSSGQGQSAVINNLTIAADTASLTGGLLYPGGFGDVAVSITNPNTFPVEVTAVSIPANSTSNWAAGYTDSGLTTAVSASGCDANNSTVYYRYAGNSNPHTLTTPLVVAANSTLTAKLTGVAAMATSAPYACASVGATTVYFKMPAFTAVTASGGAFTPSSNGITSSWTS